MGTPSDLSPLLSATTVDIGLKLHYYDSVDSAAFLGRENSSGALVWYSRGTDSANVFTGTVLGNVKIGSMLVANTTASTSTTTGALQIKGGAGIAGDVYAGSIQNTPIGSTTASTGVFTSLTNSGVHISSGNIVAAATTVSTDANSGALVVKGGVGIAGNVFTAGWMVPTGNTTQNLGTTSNWWGTLYGVSTQAKYADLAENYQADATYTPGQVVMFGGTQEVTIASADTTAVAGVISTNPAHLMNGGLNGPNVVAVALQGRVPCNVIGPTRKGDLLVSAGFGYARVNNSPAVGTVIGKALADFTGSKGVIEVVVGRT